MENHGRVVSHTRSKLPFIIAFLLILFLVPSGIFLYSRTIKKAPAPSPTPLVFSTPTPSPSATEAPAALKTFESKKLKNVSFSGFNFSYPEDWSVTENRSERNSTTKIIIEKKSYAILIQQGAFDGGLCVYKDSDLPKGEVPVSDKRKFPYKDLSANFGNLRRDEEVSTTGEIGYAFCQENQEDGSFSSLTKVGAISYGGPAKWNDGIIDEMDKIIESIKEI